MDLRSFPISQQSFLLFQFLEQVLILGSLDELVDGVDISFLGTVDATVLLSNTIPSLKINHGPWRTTRSHLPWSRAAFHFLLCHAHPILM